MLMDIENVNALAVIEMKDSFYVLRIIVIWQDLAVFGRLKLYLTAFKVILHYFSVVVIIWRFLELFGSIWR